MTTYSKMIARLKPPQSATLDTFTVSLLSCPSSMVSLVVFYAKTSCSYPFGNRFLKTPTWPSDYIYVAPYSRPVPYSRHSPYSRHFFNDTHENDCVWTLFPIAVSGDHSSTQVCKEILSILSIFFGEASQRYHAKLFSPDVSFSTQNIIIIIFEIPR